MTEQKVKPQPKKKSSNNKYMLRFFKKIAIYAVIIWAILTFVFCVTTVKGNYMFPSLRDGDLVVSYRLKPAVSGEAVIYKTSYGTRVGRIIAMEGDSVEITEAGEVIVNGSRMTEEIFYPTVNNVTQISFPYVVPSGTVFVLNDYRSLDDQDSRSFGAVDVKNIKGSVQFVFRRRGI